MAEDDSISTRTNAIVKAVESKALADMSAFKPEYVNVVQEMFSRGCSLKETAAALGVSLTALQRWRDTDAYFDNVCTRALALGFEVLADSLTTIPEEIPDVQVARLKSDNVKWLLARRASAKYGDRLDININETVNIRGALEAAKARALPIRYQQETIDAELVETKQISPSIATDCKSDAAKDTPKSGDAGDIDLEDLLK